jgi:hypothetical protein
LRFARQVVVNSETNPVVAAPAHSAPAHAKAASKRK